MATQADMEGAGRPHNKLREMKQQLSANYGRLTRAHRRKSSNGAPKEYHAPVTEDRERHFELRMNETTVQRMKRLTAIKNNISWHSLANLMSNELKG